MLRAASIRLPRPASHPSHRLFSPLPPPHTHAALGSNKSFHYTNIVGAGGAVLGRVRYAFSVKRPLHDAVRAYRGMPRSRPPSEELRGDAFVVAAAKVGRMALVCGGA